MLRRPRFHVPRQVTCVPGFRDGVEHVSAHPRPGAGRSVDFRKAVMPPNVSSPPDSPKASRRHMTGLSGQGAEAGPTAEVTR